MALRLTCWDSLQVLVLVLVPMGRVWVWVCQSAHCKRMETFSIDSVTMTVQLMLELVLWLLLLTRQCWRVGGEVLLYQLYLVI